MSRTIEADAARLRITLLDIDPAPWREIEISLSMSFKGLHDCIQAAFLWHDAHLWEFEFADRRYGIPFDDDMFGDVKIFKAETARLTKLRTSGVNEFLYVYDMGDNWEHHIEVVKLLKADQQTPLPRFVEGKYRRPPEDIGGFPGFEMFLDALGDPKHAEHKHLLDWYGGPFNRDDMEEETIHAQMKRLANKRRRKK